MSQRSTPLTELNSSSIPYGYCHCGCGERTTVAPQADNRYGYKQGEPRKFINGHAQRIYRYCKQCGAKYTGPKSRVYCSKECRKLAGYPPAWNKGRKGVNPGRARNGAAKTCEQCDGSFYVPLSTLRQKYCSPTCYLISRWPESRLLTRACVICGAEFQSYASAKQTTCGNPTCTSERKSEAQRGEKCHFWRGGKTAPYNNDWKAIRRRVLERDNYLCQLCSSIVRPQVHHIIPYRYSQSHAKENLVTLCRPCHSREELKVNAAYRAGLLARWPKKPAAAQSL